MSLKLTEMGDSLVFLPDFASLPLSLLFFFRLRFLGVSFGEMGISILLTWGLPDFLREESIYSSVRWGAINFIFSAMIPTTVGPTYPSWPSPLSTNLSRGL
jgi:hypothetical protein